MQLIAYANPLYYVVEAARTLAGGTVASWSVAQALLVMAGVMTVVFWWATQTNRKVVA
jgi:ABC-type multidrug transport system permease subunit